MTEKERKQEKGDGMGRRKHKQNRRKMV